MLNASAGCTRAMPTRLDEEPPKVLDVEDDLELAIALSQSLMVRVARAAARRRPA